MAKNGKKSFLDYFKINDSSDEYEDDLFDDDEYDDDEDDFDEEYEPKPKAVNGRSSASTYTAAATQSAGAAAKKSKFVKPAKNTATASNIQSLFHLTTEVRAVPSRYLLLNRMNLMMHR